MDTIKFSKNVTDKQAKGLDLDKASKALEGVMIRDLEVKQSGNGGWKFHATKRVDIKVALEAMTGDDVMKLAREKLIINKQSAYRDSMMDALGLNPESATAKKIRVATEALFIQLKKKGMKDNDIQEIIANTFS